MKKKIAALAIIAALASISVMGTLAYFTDSGTAHNIITSGGIDIEIVETQLDPQSGAEVPYPQDPIIGVMPGESVSKIVTVKNLEESEKAWIRVMVNTAISETGDQITNQTTKNLPLEIEVIENGSTKVIPVVTFELNQTYWDYNEDDGFYYHKEPVEAGKLTAPLFKAVKFAPEMGNEYQNSVVYIDVFAEAVQSANNGETYKEIKSWTEVPVSEE